MGEKHHYLLFMRQFSFVHFPRTTGTFESVTVTMISASLTATSTLSNGFAFTFSANILALSKFLLQTLIYRQKHLKLQSLFKSLFI